MSALTLDGIEKKKHNYRMHCFLLSVQELKNIIQEHRRMLRVPQEKQLNKIVSDLPLEEVLEIEVKALEWLTMCQTLGGEKGIAFLQAKVQEFQQGAMDMKTLTTFFQSILAMFKGKQRKTEDRRGRVSFAAPRK